MNSKFQEVYNKIITQEHLITEGWWSDVKKMAKDWINGDNADRLYYDSGAGIANDLTTTVQKLYQLFYTNFKNVPYQPFKELQEFLKQQKGWTKAGVHAAAQDASDRLNSDIVAADKAVCDAVSSFKDGIKDAVQKVYDGVSANIVMIINYIVQAFKYSKDKVIAAFNSALDATKNLANDVRKKIKGLIANLADISVKITNFTLSTATQIATIIGKIAMLQIGIVILVGQEISEKATEFYDLAIVKGKEAIDAGEKFCNAAKDEINITIKTIGKLGDAVAQAHAEAKQEVAAAKA